MSKKKKKKKLGENFDIFEFFLIFTAVFND